jgi:hypothetical protein
MPTHTFPLIMHQLTPNVTIRPLFDTNGKVLHHPVRRRNEERPQWHIVGLGDMLQ